MHKLLAKVVNNPARIYDGLSGFGLTNWVPDEMHLKLMWKSVFGPNAHLDLDNPTSFNEKLQWLKLHDRNPLYTMLVDKYAVKQWVTERIGPEYVTETYAKWDRAEDIDISGLPERFVLKTNHDCGGVAICCDRDAFDLEAAKCKLGKHLRTNYFWRTREWPYKNVKPCVFAEEYLESESETDAIDLIKRDGDITDYKFMCFGGECQCVFTCTGRAAGDLRVDFFDREWNHLPFTRHYPNADIPPAAPEHLREMLKASEKLSKEIPFVRVDFYELADRFAFGEMTFYPGGGFEEFSPEEWDERLGSWIDLGELGLGGGCLLMNNKWMMLMKPASACLAPKGTIDYKFYCFDGEPRFLYVSQGLEDHATASISFLDMDWSRAPFKREDYSDFEALPPRPKTFDKMVEIARKLSVGIPFVRVDLFECRGKPRFSEMTLYPCAGFMQFQPEEWDKRVGDMLELPKRAIW